MHFNTISFYKFHYNYNWPILFLPRKLSSSNSNAFLTDAVTSLSFTAFFWAVSVASFVSSSYTIKGSKQFLHLYFVEFFSKISVLQYKTSVRNCWIQSSQSMNNLPSLAIKRTRYYTVM